MTRFCLVEKSFSGQNEFLENMTKKDILNLIKQDKWMMKIIHTAATLNLPDWLIGAGFVRNKVWNHLSGKEEQIVDTADIDLVYFDPNGNNDKENAELSEKLKRETVIPWEVVNEAYLHKSNDRSPYTSAEDAISQWPETATAIGVTVDKEGKLKLIAPYGINDLVNFIVRPSPKFTGGIERVRERMTKKKWQEKWPHITIYERK